MSGRRARTTPTTTGLAEHAIARLERLLQDLEVDVGVDAHPARRELAGEEHVDLPALHQHEARRPETGERRRSGEDDGGRGVGQEGLERGGALRGRGLARLGRRLRLVPGGAVGGVALALGHRRRL